MKHHSTPVIGRFLTAAMLACFFVASAHAAPRGGPARPGARRPPGENGPAADALGARGLGNIEELAAKRDAFNAFRRLNFEGIGFYTKEDELIGLHARIYHGIEEATVTDRLDEPQGRSFVDELLSIGKKAAALRGSAEKLSDADATAVRQDLETLGAKVRKAAANEVNPAILSPNINHLQWTMDELYRFALAGGASAGRADAIRRHADALEHKEDSFKADGKLSDHEREELMKAAREAWLACIKAFA